MKNTGHAGLYKENDKLILKIFNPYEENDRSLITLKIKFLGLEKSVTQLRLIRVASSPSQIRVSKDG